MRGLDKRERGQVAVGVGGAVLFVLLAVWANLLLLIPAALNLVYAAIALRHARRRRRFANPS
jgi:hypothetical protein